ncbi:Clock-associated two-component sensor histidine kinase SasA [uncultured Synechococcales cyanobacterium]|uniref:Adaptive-response sensory-kinase SasA n=1 Tax=uncultured Synechococcales cyanobacterium TaxID=1936017 RepID=A0A6J4VUP1_9CYAN|nr:Clock-associated two-component sensor histidine kinase SasA [uncultured Synechococcales cyanobacterium]
MRSSPNHSPEITGGSQPPLKLLLFIDKRPSSIEQLRRIRSQLKNLKPDYAYDLTVVDVAEQPYLAEHFKLVATPCLIKVYPEPWQTLAGSNLVNQLIACWPFWQQSTPDCLTQSSTGNHPTTSSAEIFQLSDQVFRLKQEQEALQEQLRFKDRLVAMLAHDLRNPLTAVSMALETIEFSWSLENELALETREQLMKHARTQARVIEQMITDLLESGRGSLAELQIQPRKLVLMSLYQEVIEPLITRIKTKSQQVKIDIPNDLPAVYADGEKVRQVLTNLLDNAIKYTPAGGVIKVSMLHRTTQKVQVSISDNGLGIPVENQKQIFEEQFRLPRDQDQEGYGIGLALCQRIIRAHYGQLWVDSLPQQGSCFHFTLPVYPT